MEGGECRGWEVWKVGSVGGGVRKWRGWEELGGGECGEWGVGSEECGKWGVGSVGGWEAFSAGFLNQKETIYVEDNKCQGIIDMCK